MLISLDRQERGRADISAIQEVERDYHCKVISIVTLKDLIAYLEEKPEMADHGGGARLPRAVRGVSKNAGHARRYLYCSWAANSGQRASNSCVGR